MEILRDSALQELQTYRNTGLTPEQCAEYAKAEEEGLLVRLPCKVGDTVFIEKAYEYVTEEIVRKIEILDTGVLFVFGRGWAFSEEDIGKTVFLTREAAEAALTADDRKSRTSGEGNHGK